MNFSRFGAKPTRRRRRRQAGSISNIPANRADVRLLRSKRGKHHASAKSPASLDRLHDLRREDGTNCRRAEGSSRRLPRCPSAHLQELAIATTAPVRTARLPIGTLPHSSGSVAHRSWQLPVARAPLAILRSRTPRHLYKIEQTRSARRTEDVGPAGRGTISNEPGLRTYERIERLDRFTSLPALRSGRIGRRLR